ncbi:MAG: gmk [Alphaproteobacteria bacterium]|jgi:guanylate kinase|nr:gmk [Alphaproteobacteria bacterium]
MAAGKIGRRGLMLVLSSPSGAGKTTLSRLLLERDADITLSISVTTRPPRSAEKDGIDYHFVTPAIFNRMVERGELLEYAKVFDYYYGTPRSAVEVALGSGRDVMFDIDWQGRQQLAEKAGEDMVSVFILPPTTRELERRLKQRAQDAPQVVANRMAKAADEMTHYIEYDYVVINYDIEDSMTQLRGILAAERLKRERQIGLGDFVKALREGQ